MVSKTEREFFKRGDLVALWCNGNWSNKLSGIIFFYSHRDKKRHYIRYPNSTVLESARFDELKLLKRSKDFKK